MNIVVTLKGPVIINFSHSILTSTGNKMLCSLSQTMTELNMVFPTYKQHFSTAVNLLKTLKNSTYITD